MINGLLGRKIGMTRIFTQHGVNIPVTVVSVLQNYITQIKTIEVDGYNAIQVASGNEKSKKRTSKSMQGHFMKAEITAKDHIAEFHVPAVDEFKIGQLISIENIVKAGDYIDVTGTSKGKGFAGTVKRHNFSTQDATHGNSLSHRAAGSIGQNQSPGRVFKGKKMAGHMGNEKVTIQSLEIVKIDNEKNVILVKGAVPGAKGTKLKLTLAKKRNK